MTRRARRLTILTALVLIAACATVCQAAFPPIALQAIPDPSGQLLAPVGMTNAGDGSGRLFVIDQGGKIDIVQNGAVLPTPFLDLSSKLVPLQSGYDERGLLGLAFHPDYSRPGTSGAGKFYVFYSAPSPNAPGTTANPVNCRTTIAEFRVSGSNPNVADPTSERIVLSFDKPQFNHNSGQLAFGPDRLLYIGTGDGGGADDNDAGHTGGSAAKPSGVLGNAQDTTKLLGKILRIDPLGAQPGQYTIPADNPFVGASSARPEIYAYGFRNPWRFSFDTGPGSTGRLFVADVGQNLFEEIDTVQKGGNYGWRAKEGFHAFDPTTPNPRGDTLLDPLLEYTHPGQNNGDQVIGIAVVGGIVYRGTVIPGLAGKYVFGDWSNVFAAPGNGTLLGAEETAPDTWSFSRLDVEGKQNGELGQFVTAFGQDESGELYVVTRTSLGPTPASATGTIFKIVAVPEPATLLMLSFGGLCAAAYAARRGRRSSTMVSTCSRGSSA